MQREWIRGDGTPLPLKSYQRDGTLYIDDVQYEDAGDYRCLIRDHTGSVLFGVSATLEISSKCSISNCSSNKTKR